MKPCTRCHIIKDLTLFPKDHRAKDGRASRCNACMSEIGALYRRDGRDKERKAKYRNSDKGKTKRAAYAKTEKAKEQRRRYAQTEKGKEVMRLSREKYRQKVKQTKEGKLRIQARMAVRHATENDILPPIATLRCYLCNSQAEHYHHPLGYNKPYWLHVVPVCRTCHIKLHFTPEAEL